MQSHCIMGRANVNKWARPSRCANQMRAGVRRGQDASVPPLDQPAAIGALITAYESLTADLPSAPPPGPEPLALVRRVLDGLSGQPGPDGWDGTEYALKGRGRAVLTAADRAQLGAAADRYPLFG